MKIQRQRDKTEGLRWERGGTYSWGTVVGLYAIAFDGANIWVANWGGNSVTKIW